MNAYVELPTFEAFYRAAHDGQAPFPWQVRLAAQVVAQRAWPELLDLPTGVGKTSALDVALYTLAAAPEHMPRRTVLVVDRRIVVDQAAEHARKLLRKLSGAKDGATKIIADRLRALFDADEEEAPFIVAVMRGGMPRDNDWARRPDQPVLGVSTVDQVGSRLLFRGYGVGPKSASIHAGLLANDTLVLLDEVHLAVPFAQTLEAIQRRFRRPVDGLPNRFGVVQMSATPRCARDASGAAPQPFQLDDVDRSHPVLAQRLRATKSARLVEVKVTGSDEDAKRATLAKRAIEEARTLLAAGANVVGVVVNRVDTARLVARMLSAQSQTMDALLVTGRMRAIERDALVRTALLPRAGAGRKRSDGARPLVVVATQCIEAGADLDFDGLVTECASLDALRQRFGRVDRRGELGASQSVILGRSDTVALDADDPVYGAALANTWAWLRGIAADEQVDFGINGLPVALDDLGNVRTDLIAPAIDAPVMLPAHLDAWAQTSPRPTPDHDVALWLHGPARPGADVQIIWRIGMTGLSAETAVEQLSACRPSSLESITVPIKAARRWLAGETASSIADVVSGDTEGSDERARREAPTPDVALRWRGDDSDWIGADKVRPGDVLIVDAARGGISDLTFDPDASTPVADLGDIAQLRGRGVASLRLDDRAIAVWGMPAGTLGKIPAVEEDESAADLRVRVGTWLLGIPEDPTSSFPGTPAEWHAATEAWRRTAKLRTVVVDERITAIAPVVRNRLVAEYVDATTEDDDSSFRSIAVSLAQHSVDVRTMAAKFARGVGLSAAISADVTLAGWLHDVGKADPRFQRWMVGGSEISASKLPEPLAKSGLASGNRAARVQAQERAGYPRGYRHELLSVEMITGNAALDSAHDRELVLHLVGSHHGWCRPFAPPIDDPEEFEVSLNHDGVALKGTSRHRLSRLDSGVSERFWGLIDRYGWWGLAWLEAIMRLADHRTSENESAKAR